jgi:tetratricopeptide (TPR) repeat protein
MPKTTKTVLFLSGILAILPAIAQTQTPRQLDVLEEIQRMERERAAISPLRAEYKNTAEAAALAGAELVPYAVPAPPIAISVQRLSHRPTKAARKAFALGAAVQRKGRQAEAIEHFATAVSLDPLYVEARAELGVLYVRTGEISKALEQFERGSELEPNSTMLRFNRACMLLSLGRAAEAEAEARRVLVINPRAVDAQRLVRLAILAEAATY